MSPVDIYEIMPKLTVSTDHNKIKIAQKFNAFYRSVGIVSLSASVYWILYPIITGEHIVYRDQLDLTFFSIPGVIMGLLAFLSKVVTFDTEKKMIAIKYIILTITIYSKKYRYTDDNKLILSKDSKQIPMSSQPRENQTYESHVVPWYSIRLIYDRDEVLVCKATNAKEIRDIADSINKLTHIPIELAEHFPYVTTL